MAEQVKANEKEMQLKITGCSPVYSGKNTRGDDYTIFEIFAEKPDGTPITEKLRAFTALPVGQFMDVTVKAFNSEEHGRSFTVFPKDKKASATQAVNELTEMVTDLMRRVGELERRGGV
jgi:hypothetical protein